jgi:chromosome segregation ATPase
MNDYSVSPSTLVQSSPPNEQTVANQTKTPRTQSSPLSSPQQLISQSTTTSSSQSPVTIPQKEFVSDNAAEKYSQLRQEYEQITSQLNKTNEDFAIFKKNAELQLDELRQSLNFEFEKSTERAKTIEQLSKEIAQQKEQIQQRDKTIERYSMQISTLQNELATLKLRMQSLELQLRQEIDSHDKTKRDFQEYQKKAKKIVHHLQSSLNDVLEQKRKWDDDYLMFEEMKKRVHEVQLAEKNTNELLKETQRRLEKEEKENSALRNRCLLLESDIKVLRERNNVEVKTVGQSYQIVAGDKVKLEQEHRYIKIAAHKLKRKFLLLKEQNEKLSAKNSELSKQIKELQTQLRAMENMQSTSQSHLSLPKKGSVLPPTAMRSQTPARQRQAQRQLL